ncbi:MAG TPA: hypothetical protein VFC82_03700 [Actinomycetaceae bacterium]|nr:hypothetical protein [Actinomycetaceae bacterium]
MADVKTGTFSGINVAGVMARALLRPDIARAATTFVRTVLKDFFWLQFSVKLGIREVGIVNVDHPLDAEVPFAPEKVGTYLDFINFWIRPFGYLRRRFGDDAQQRYAVEFLRLIDQCYREAAGVYRVQMSTTRRPRRYRGRFLLIQLFDPHLLCVPSLHVMILVLTHTFYRRAFAELGVTGAEADGLNRELFDGAVEITESVLYLKQHSVNCIPAALYAMSRITPDQVTASEVDAFIDSLFVDESLLDDDAGARIRACIRESYARLTADGRDDADWAPAVLRFLQAYRPVDAVQLRGGGAAAAAARRTPQ